VCDDGWDDTNAGVVCRQLGFGSSGTVQQIQFASGSENMRLSNFACSGDESTLLNCDRTRVKLSNCAHFENVVVACSGPIPGIYVLHYIYMHMSYYHHFILPNTCTHIMTLIKRISL